MEEAPDEASKKDEILGFLENSGVKILVVLGASATNYLFWATEKTDTGSWQILFSFL